MGITRDNHYVPRWYLNRFIEEGETGLYCLDLDKFGKLRPDGTPIPQREPRPQSVKSLFYERDLYTTFFGVHLSDEIERHLFGRIDDGGKEAVCAFAKGDPKAIHENYQFFFQYLNAQLLRTPKGLSWLAAQYRNLSGNDRLMEMQRFLTLYCPMWVESVLEIVSAEKSDVKFLVTDAPVTIYNQALPPESEACKFPFDPRVELIGSQTLFPLGADQLLILTHLQYAKPENGPPNLTAERENARYHGSSLGRIDTIIRGRSLSSRDVVAVNTVLKARARRYVAAGKPAWLHPERTFTGTWQDVAPVLLPPRSEMLWYGGDVYIGFEGGGSAYRDPYGRTSKAHEFLKKKPAPADLSGDSLCGCGSGQRFDSCCMVLPATERPAWDVYSIRDRNLILCRAIVGILELDKGKDWTAVRRELSDDQVKRIYEIYALLWPADTDLAALLPRPNPTVHRGVLLGALDARALGWSVAAPLGCFDQLVLPHPFTHHEFMSPEYSPVVNPAHHKMMLLRFVWVMMELRPLIEQGLVHLVPDPADFNPHYRDVVNALAREAATGWHPTKAQKAEFEWMHRDELLRAHLQLPQASLERLIRKAAPEVDGALHAAAAAQLKAHQEQDPLALLQPTLPGEKGRHLMVIKGFNFETAAFLGGLVSGSIYCDNRMSWGLLRHAAKSALHPTDELNQRLSNLRIPVQLDVDDAGTARESGTDAALRQCFRALTADEGAVERFDLALLEAIRDHHTATGHQAAGTGEASVEVLLAKDGLLPIESQRLQLQFARRGAVEQTRLAFLIRWDRQEKPRHEHGAEPVATEV